MQADEYDRRTKELDLIIRPLRTARYEVDSDWRYFEQWLNRFGQDYGGLDLNPDFQRGHVWTPEQQQGYIENALRGVVSTSGFLVQMNCPNFDDDGYQGDLPRGMQCIDGLQRITSVIKYLAGEVRPFGLSVHEFDDSAYSARRSLYRMRIAVHNFQSRQELLQHYLDLNAGGTPHSLDEIERVRMLKDAALTMNAPRT